MRRTIPPGGIYGHPWPPREAPHRCNSLHRFGGCGRVRRMSLEHAILVSLSERPASGLDLTRRFDRSIGFFWSATHQQIYRVLARMEADGWVRCRHVAQHGRADKKVYAVAAAGRGELRRWLATPVPMEQFRSEVAV